MAVADVILSKKIQLLYYEARKRKRKLVDTT